MMNKDNRNDKIRKIVKKGLTFSLCAVLVGGLAAGSFEGVNKLAGWDGAATVEAASNKNETTLTFAKSEKEADSDESDSKADDSKDTSSKTTGSLDISDIAAEALPSIVSITTKSVQEVQSYYGMYGMYGYAPQQQEQEVEGSGSGIIVGKNDDELLIATNYHVVENADTLSVAFADGNAVEASVKGFDEERDLAVVSVALDDIKDDTMDAISVTKIGSSDDLKVGEQVVAIGNALGYGQSVTTGIVSAKNRRMDSEKSTVTDGSKAWLAKGGDTNWAAVTSPDLSSEGYTAPDLATVEQTAVNPGDKDATVNVYYKHGITKYSNSTCQKFGC